MKREILLIEPDDDLAAVRSNQLQEVGFTVSVASLGSVGLRRARKAQPHAILLERRLEDMDVMDLIATLRSGKRTALIPLIVSSSLQEPEDVVACLTAGANDYVNKGISAGELLARIRVSLRRSNEDFIQLPGGPMVVNPRFIKREFRTGEGMCFVLMPYGAEWSERVWQHLKRLIERENLRCERAKEWSGEVILEDIWAGINEAEIIVADVTGKNPNVMYEVGIAHTVGKRVVLLVQDEAEIIFDLGGKRHIIYEDNVDGFKKISRELPALLHDVE